MKIVRVQMWYVYIQLLDDQTQKDFLVIYMFLKVFLYSIYVLIVFPKNPICLLKNSFRGIFMSKNFSQPILENEEAIFSSSQFLHREFHDYLTTLSWEVASRETSLMLLRPFHE